MLVARIVHKLYANTLFASGMRGRWNSTGNKVIYTSESIPLAFMENMVRRQGVGFNTDFKIMLIQIPDDVLIESVAMTSLETGWRDPNDYSQCQPLGDKWFNAGKSPVLKVPSAVMPEAFNYVINTSHPDYARVELLAVTDLVPDARIEEILKKYS
ncbi:RES family NAD+ phosphorylase [Dyadobacter sp. CY261]|uniref:RES family NAD+ phosphorylase n=1 Tax=Dyadobacter sp. CY261 TaxID=2907203 RepID=UPI001F361CA7|nr:RES family NAD+ phosphorylase [Dyadobacter sp. CY261]MCF0071184.1 RES family NAD+ phosphorylase [Dyadobacter sp. CY261]